ncbi:Na+/H+ antiporter NhaA [Nakamurella flavida]
MHASGLDTSVAGVRLGFTVPVIRSRGAGGPDAGSRDGEHLRHLWRPVSAGFAVPVFRVLPAGGTVRGLSGLVDSLQDRVALGIVLGRRQDRGHPGCDGAGSSIQRRPGWRRTCPSGPAASAPSTSREESWRIRSWPQRWPRSCCGCIYRRLHQRKQSGTDLDGPWGP